MTYAQMQAELAKMLGNMTSATNPVWYPLIAPASGAEATGIIYRAANRLVEMETDARPDLDAGTLFPELKSGVSAVVTSAGSNTVPRPAGIFVAITKVTSADQPTLPDWRQIEERKVSWTDQTTISIMNKAGVSDYPQLYSRTQDAILYYPTTDADTVTYLRLYGLLQEIPLVAGTDKLLMSERRHNAVITLAAAMMAEKMGWAARAQAWYASVQYERDHTMNADAQERPLHFVAEIEDAPTWQSVNDWSVP